MPYFLSNKTWGRSPACPAKATGSGQVRDLPHVGVLLAVLLVSAALLVQGQQPAPAPPVPAQPDPAQPAPAQPAPVAPPALAPSGGFLIPNATLTEMIDILAKRLKINYILDPRVKGTVTIYTYGEVKPVDEMQILETILRINGATMVKVGDLYRIVPVAQASQLPVDPIVNGDSKTLPDDERVVLNLIFLKYATATELDKLIAPFLGEGGKSTVYEPANLIIIQDNARSMRRTMGLISIFDADTFAGQRVRLFDVENARPSDLVKDLDTVFKAYSLSDKTGAVRFIPIDRINTLIAVAPNPGIFGQVEDWIKKLDVPVKITAGEVTNYVYRLKYGRAETVALAIMALYTGNIGALVAAAQQANAAMISNGIGNPTFGINGSNYGGVGFNPGYGNYGNYGNYGGYQGGYGAYPGAAQPPAATPFGAVPVQPTAGAQGGAPQVPNQTGTYLSYPAAGGFGMPPGAPHIVPNPFDNTLIIQASPQEYQRILSLLQQIDVPPRQVLIEVKIYEVDLMNDLAGGVETYLQKVGSNAATSVTPQINGNPANVPDINAPAPSRTLAAITSSAGLGLTTGALVLKSHELLATLSASELRSRTRVIQSPSIIATDSVPATLNVGNAVPTLSSVASTGVQQNGTSVFANNINTVSTGVTLSITAHVNTSGVVTMLVNQQVSTPQAPAATAAIQSPSFQNRSLSTQMTVQDGDTVAIGGIITENHTEASNGIPFLHRIPVIGAAFGAKDVHTDRVELIIFLTPRVIYDTIQLDDATEEIKSNLKRVSKLLKDE